MNYNEKLNLKKMINESECENNTDLIRKVKHSSQIHVSIGVLQQLKRDHAELKESNYDEFALLCQNKCSFLYNNYSDIFFKVLKDELNLHLMSQMLNVLKKIEEGEVDQHEGSVLVGKLLKEIYIDSALKSSENLDKKSKQEEVELVDPIKISWKEYKSKNSIYYMDNIPVLQIAIDTDDVELYEIYSNKINIHNEMVRTSETPDSGFDLFIPKEETFIMDVNSSTYNVKIINLKIKGTMIENKNTSLIKFILDQVYQRLH